MKRHDFVQDANPNCTMCAFEYDGGFCREEVNAAIHKSSKTVDIGTYVLDENGEPREEHNIIAWAEWMEVSDRRVGRDEINGLDVSTIFLGVNNRFIPIGPPILWETMIFTADGRPLFQERYTSRAQAEAGHRAIVERAKNGEWNDKQDD